MTADDLASEHEHMPRRPDWICRTCHRPWPCPTRRDMLVVESRDHPVAVALYLATCFQEASEHLTEVSYDVLYERMLGWLPRARRSQ